MPIPKPSTGEKEQEFVSRCISSIIDEYDQSQAAAICYKTYREEMSEEKEVFVLSPRKKENRGSYISRCSAHSKIKSQFPNMKERLGFCLNAFNEYYRYWNRMEDFSEADTKGTAIGACIAKKKSQGLDYKAAYARCASKVVVQPGPIVMEEDNLLVEPVSFGMDISVDFDDTFNTKRGQELVQKLIDEGNIIHIITRRQQAESAPVFELAKKFGIPKERIHFTNGKLKWETIKRHGIQRHIDNNADEIKAIKENIPDIEAVKFSDIKFGDLSQSCWPGYVAYGKKILDGKEVPNCVPEEK